MTWNAPGDAVPIVLDCIAKPGLKVSQVGSSATLQQAINIMKWHFAKMFYFAAPSEKEGGPGVRCYLGQFARHREGEG